MTEPVDVACEVAVLVRDHRDSGLAYTFSFVGLEEAYDFLRREVAHGLCLTDAALYFAVPVTFSGEYAVASLKRPPLARPTALIAAADPEPNSVTACPDPVSVGSARWVEPVKRFERWPAPVAGAAFQDLGRRPAASSLTTAFAHPTLSP